MHLVYLFATILGGVLLGISVLGAGHHVGGHGGDTPAASLFSLRMWTYFLAFGGATGLFLQYLTAAGVGLTAALAGGVGAATGLTARATIRRMLRSGEGGTIKQHELVGKSASVLVPALRGATGTVRLRVKNSTVDVLAVCDDGDLGPKDEVIIVEMKEGRALVARAPEDMKRLGPKS